MERDEMRRNKVGAMFVRRVIQNCPELWPSGETDPRPIRNFEGCFIRALQLQPAPTLDCPEGATNGSTK